MSFQSSLDAGQARRILLRFQWYGEWFGRPVCLSSAPHPTAALAAAAPARAARAAGRERSVAGDGRGVMRVSTTIDRAFAITDRPTGPRR